MSKSIILRAAAIAAAAVFCAPSFAADNQNLQVTATVGGTCKLTAVPAMAFTLDPSVGTNQSTTSTVVYKCTKGLSAGSFTVGGVTTGTHNGTLAGTGGNTDTIAYQVTWGNPTAFTGTGFGAGSTGKSVTLTGAIAGANYSNVAADTYSGSVAITIAP